MYTEVDDRATSDAADSIIDEDGRSFGERIEAAAWAILDSAQDAVLEITTEEWPIGPNGKVVEAGVRVDGERLLMWFGDEQAPVIALAPITIDEILEGAA